MQNLRTALLWIKPVHVPVPVFVNDPIKVQLLVNRRQLVWLSFCFARADMAHIVKTLKEFGLCSAVHYKEMYIPESEISGKLLQHPVIMLN